MIKQLGSLEALGLADTDLQRDESGGELRRHLQRPCAGPPSCMHSPTCCSSHGSVPHSACRPGWPCLALPWHAAVQLGREALQALDAELGLMQVGCQMAP